MKWFDIMDKDSVDKGIEDMLRKAIRNAAYYDNDPEQGGQRIPRNKSVAFQEMIKKLEEVTGLPYVPTDDSEQMKVVRYELYSNELKAYIERRQWNSSLETDNESIRQFRQLWLENEIECITRWISETPKDRPEIIIELNKYGTYIAETIKSIKEEDPESIHEVCTADNFKTDISELCAKCPLIQFISSTISKQIVFQAKQQKEILTDTQFIEYCNDEIKNAQKEMMKMSLLVQQDKDDPKFRNARTEVFIWNKERIKALSRVQSDTPQVKPSGKADIEIEISDFDDPAKMQRGITSLVQQYQYSKGNPAPYKHPFLWHTKFRHEKSSPYVLEINKDQDITDESGTVLKRVKVQLVDSDIDEAFIKYFTSCHINDIAPFLAFQFDKYYNGLLANQSPQPFFEYLIELVEMVNKRGLLYKAEADSFYNWVVTNLHYQSKTITKPTEQLVKTKNVKAEVRFFAKLLADGYTVQDLDRLLIHLRMKKSNGENIWPLGMKAALYGVVDALIKKNHLIRVTQIESHISLSKYLGLPETRVKKGYSEIETEIKEKAISFLNQPIKRKK